MFLDYTEIATLISEKQGKLPIPTKQDYEVAKTALLGDNANFSIANRKAYKHAILSTAIAILYPCGEQDDSAGDQAVKALTTAFADQAMTDPPANSKSQTVSTTSHKNGKGKKFNWMIFWIILGSVLVVGLIVIGFVVIRQNKRIE